MEPKTRFQLNDKVIIGGRTMLRPGLSLVGLTGRVVSSRHDAPPGTIAVWVDWDDSPFADWDDLPSTVNVPSMHLEHFDESRRDEPPPPPPRGRPKLRLT